VLRRWSVILACLLSVSCNPAALIDAGPTGIEIAGWGDSLTSDNGAHIDYLSDLSELLNRPTRNGGVSGEISSQILARILADDVPHNRVSIFWMGRNNYRDAVTVEADIAAAIAHLHGDRRFLVLSIINGDYEGEQAGSAGYAEIEKLNSDLAAQYPENFVDVRSALVASYNSSDARDVASHAADEPPASLRVDALHLNAAGNWVVARTIAPVITAKGW
jgi:lysophospholipase L1-like esterase